VDVQKGEYGAWWPVCGIRHDIGRAFHKNPLGQAVTNMSIINCVPTYYGAL
jgi:hypothetical protein